MPPKKSTPYYIHHLSENNLDKKEIIAVSIDPGTVSYGLAILRIAKDRSGKVLHVSRTHLNPPRKKSDPIVPDKYVSAYGNLNKLLKKHLDLIKTCNLIVIEKQMPFNYKATRIAQHTLAFMTLMLDHDPAIIEIEPRVKTSVLRKKGEEPNAKIWSIEYAKKVLEMRGDIEALEIIERERKIKKADDVCDVVTQIDGYLQFIEWFDDCVKAESVDTVTVKSVESKEKVVNIKKTQKVISVKDKPVKETRKSFDKLSLEMLK